MMATVSSPTPLLRFEDLRVGTLLTTGDDYEITRDEIVEIARRFDPQPFHLDDDAGAASHFGGLVASGIHTLAVSVRLGAWEAPATAAVAGLGMDEIRMLQPVRPGDRLQQTTEITELRPSASRADRGIVRGKRTVRNQNGVAVMTYILTWMVERTPPATAP
jgi:acyl dehydratase